ncbi:MAG: lipopolysaccharide biosynthesis protein [Paludibacteraceae bacterium]|nr:lipopolysaccharide biosynthesis protein [Paludibacteraceae bacterium]
MAEELGQKTKKSLVWSILDKIGSQFIGMLIGIISARLLCPEDFGTIGCLTIFTSISAFIIESGFGVAMLRKETISREEYSAVLYFNIGVSLTIYGVLFALSGSIEKFFSIDKLAAYAHVLFLILPINALCIIQYTQIRKQFKFKQFTYANLIANIISALSTIVLIHYNYGCWALVWQQVTLAATRTILLWFFNPFIPSQSPQFKIIRELFSYSSILALNYIITSAVGNIYNFILGKYFTTTDLGYYSNGRKYNDILSQVVIGNGISSVAAPSLAELNKNKTKQLHYLQKFGKLGFFTILPTLTLLSIVIEDIVTIVFTEKWLPMVPYFRILSLSGMLYPLQTLYQHFFLMTGHKNLSFMLDMVKNTLIIILAIVCILYFDRSPHYIVWSSVLAMFITTLLEIIYVRNLAGYKIKNQLTDYLPIFVRTIIVAVIVFVAGEQIHSLYMRLMTEGVLFIGLYFAITWFYDKELTKPIIEILHKK